MSKRALTSTMLVFWQLFMPERIFRHTHIYRFSFREGAMPYNKHSKKRHKQE